MRVALGGQRQRSMSSASSGSGRVGVDAREFFEFMGEEDTPEVSC